MDRLGVGVVGLGVGEAHARTYAALDGCELRWLYDQNHDRAASLAAALGAPRVAADYAAMLADDKVDVISIASYDDAHFGQVVQALRAGKHVFVEKPLSRTLDELRVVKETWQRSRRHLASNLILRAAPLYQWLRSAIADNQLGEVYSFDGDYLYGRLQKIAEGWRRDVPDYSVMEGGGVHLMDLLMWLTGQRPHRVVAAGNRIATRHTGFNYLDYVAATFEFPSGMIGRITANFGCVHRHQHVVRVFGTKQTFIHDDAGARLWESRDPEVAPSSITLPSLARTKGDLIPDFIGAIRAGQDLSTNTERDFSVLSACIAADRAAATGTPTDVIYV
jgi:predicted dehydrogenase